MTWIKICGITNLADAQHAVACGADALGFVFAESRRRVTAAAVRPIVAELPPQIYRVGVFVDESPELMSEGIKRVLETVVEAGLNVVQLHGDETLDYARALHSELAALSSPVKLIRAVRMPLNSPGIAESLGWDPVASGIVEIDPHSAEIRPGMFSAMLVDSGTAESRGGTGRAFDWHRTRALLGLMHGYTRVIVAGGLRPDNVGEAIEVFHPWGVDVSTGVERAPGIKDLEKVQAFVNAVRAAERRL
jgi:phosphoribosylanthranilate isomerase